MRKIYKLLLVLCAALIVSACSEDLYGGSDGREGKKVTLKLSYEEVLPREIVSTRATDAENVLNNLQIFVFDAQGRLKGYRYIKHNASASDDTNLDQTGNSKEVKVKTTTGDSYIYAVANVPTAIYKLGADAGIPTSDNTEGWTEEDARDGKINFTLDKLKAVAFMRETGQFDITEANFMMSGAANGGELCTIAEQTDGAAAITKPTNEEAQLIKLRRIVAKIDFEITNLESNTYTDNNKSITESDIKFTPTSYKFYNVPQRGSLIENGRVEAGEFEETANGTYSTQATKRFSIYLPENLQNKNIPVNSSISEWKDRENDDANLDKYGKKVFTNAPEHGTYVALNGTYSSKVTVGGGEPYNRYADVTYYIHLGDFGTPNNAKNESKDFNVERNCYYTYKVTVKGVNSIVVEAKKESDYQSGAEGVVLDMSTGKYYILDSHYEQVNMTFSKSDIDKLAKNTGADGNELGFMFQVHDLNGSSKIINVNGVTADDISSKLNGANYKWVEFADGASKHYPGTGKTKDLLYVLNELYNHRSGGKDANVPGFWDEQEKKTYTCFINENYYSDKSWGQYVNISPRVLYIANSAEQSADGRSTYLTLQYGLSQYSIQTFYNKDMDGKLVAYGCETIRDDNRKWGSADIDKSMLDHDSETVTLSLGADNGGKGKGSSKWDGLANMKTDIGFSTDDNLLWGDIIYSDYREACMSRNRDLDGDGKISADEIRWYCPTIAQYGGLWIGENAITENQAKLFIGSTRDLKKGEDWTTRDGAEHYFANDNDVHVFWSEEGMATGSTKNHEKNLKYVRCIRNLQSDNLGIYDNKNAALTADVYYIDDRKNFTVDLSRVSDEALRTSVQTTELVSHTERDAINSPARKFTYAKYNTRGKGITGTNDRSDNPLLTTSMSMKNAATNTNTLCHNDYYENENYPDKGTWRAPNQRELCIMNVIGAYNGNDNEGCRTHFSNSTFRYSWHTEGNLVTMGDDGAAPDKYNVSLRCVKDVQ